MGTYFLAAVVAPLHDVYGFHIHVDASLARGLENEPNPDDRLLTWSTNSLLVHLMGASATGIWHYQNAHLSRCFRCIALLMSLLLRLMS